MVSASSKCLKLLLEKYGEVIVKCKLCGEVFTPDMFEKHFLNKHLKPCSSCANKYTVYGKAFCKAFGERLRKVSIAYYVYRGFYAVECPYFKPK